MGQSLAALGFTVSDGKWLVSSGTFNWIVILLLIVWLAPNTQQIMAHYRPALDVPADTPRARLTWSPNRRWLCVHVVVALWAIAAVSRLSEFLYFQF
jgi:hypothetical protein